MNKSLLTNLIAFSCLTAGYFLAMPIVFSIGIFALSGAMTNLIAIHMLFEKVPLLYGSGVITLKFKEFKSSIRSLILEQFFSKEKVERLITEQEQEIDLTPVIHKIDLSPAFDKLVTVIEQSQFGPMLGMFGGREALEPMKPDFVEKMQLAIIEISEADEFKQTLHEELIANKSVDSIFHTVEQAVDNRLDELTPEMVKDIIQEMIKTHLGWLVVWGGVFGGLFGLLAELLR